MKSADARKITRRSVQKNPENKDGHQPCATQYGEKKQQITRSRKKKERRDCNTIMLLWYKIREKFTEVP